MSGDPIAKLWLAPWRSMRSPDRWQGELLSQIVTRQENALVCCSRQIGKTETVAAAAYLAACLGEFVLVLSPSDDQSKEFNDRVLKFHRDLNLVAPSAEPSKHELKLVSGGRTLALPNNERTVRSRSAVDLLVIDEASRVPDVLYGAVRPMLAVSGGRTVLLSTPFGKRGFFWKEWNGEGMGGWRRHRYTWQTCPRIDPAFIEDERRSHGDLWVKQEYECEFHSTSAGFFDVDAFRELIDPRLEVLPTW